MCIAAERDEFVELGLVCTIQWSTGWSTFFIDALALWETLQESIILTDMLPVRPCDNSGESIKRSS